MLGTRVLLDRLKVQFGQFMGGDAFDFFMLFYAGLTMFTYAAWELVIGLCKAAWKHFETAEQPALIFSEP